MPVHAGAEAHARDRHPIGSQEVDRDCELLGIDSPEPRAVAEINDRLGASGVEAGHGRLDRCGDVGRSQRSAGVEFANPSANRLGGGGVKTLTQRHAVYVDCGDREAVVRSGRRKDAGQGLEGSLSVAAGLRCRGVYEHHNLGRGGGANIAPPQADGGDLRCVADGGRRSGERDGGLGLGRRQARRHGEAAREESR